jgi:hypothetical protein
MMNRHTPSTLKGLLAAALVAAAAAVAPAQTASSTYRSTPRDPFAKFKPAMKRKAEKGKDKKDAGKDKNAPKAESAAAE